VNWIGVDGLNWIRLDDLNIQNRTGLPYTELDWTEIDNNWQDWASVASSRLG